MTSRPADPARGYLAAADVLRVICIFHVAWYHFWQQSWLDPGFTVGSTYVNLQQMVRNGYLMVDVLLVLSGFLLALPYARARLGLCRRISAKEFYVNRFWRIVPSYVLSLLLCLFLWAIPTGQYESGAAVAEDLLAHFTFTHNLIPEIFFRTPLLGVLWTVGVEVQFYLLFPLIVGFYEERPGLTCLALGGVAWCFRAWLYRQEGTAFWVNQLPCMLDLFACGMGAAALYGALSRKDLRPGTRRLLALGALLALLLIYQMLYRQTLGEPDQVRRGQLVLRLPLGLAAGAFLLCGCLAPQGLGKVLGNPLTRFFAAISYNYYIWHQFLALRLKDWHLPPYAAENPNMAGEQPWQLEYTLLCFLAAGIAGVLLTYLWERPVNRWGRRRMKQAEAAAR